MRNKRETDGGLTEDVEFGPPGAQGGLRGLTLKQRVIRQLGVGDLQVVLANVQSPENPVPGPGCGGDTERRGFFFFFKSESEVTGVRVHAEVKGHQ